MPKRLASESVGAHKGLGGWFIEFLLEFVEIYRKFIEFYWKLTEFIEFSLKSIEDQWNFNKIYWILLEFYCIYWYFLFFNVSPLGPAGEMEKSRFFALSDPNWTGVGKPSFCQRARLVGVTRSTEGAFDSYPTPSVRIPRCLGARGAEGGTEIAKAKRRPWGTLG